MCAIVCWAGQVKREQWPQVHELLEAMMLASVCRGTDSSGFAAITSRGRFVWDKQPLASDLFVCASRRWHRLPASACLIAHCRAATHGCPRTGDNRNNHPFVGEDNALAVVVNGISPNYRAVAKALSLRLEGECDSEVVLRMVEAAAHPAEGLQECLAELDGGLAAAVLDAGRQTVWLAKNEGRPVWLMKLVNLQGYFACSTREIAQRTLREVYGPAADQVVEMMTPLASGVVVGMNAEGRLLADSRSECWTQRDSRRLLLV